MNLEAVSDIQIVQNNLFEFTMSQPEAISADEFSNICRMCLGKQDIKPIFNITYEEITVQELLLICTSVEVQQDDGLPENICSDCLGELIRSFCFKQKCQQSDAILKHIQIKFAEEVKARSESASHIVRNNETILIDNKFDDVKVNSKESNFQEDAQILSLQTNENENSPDLLTNRTEDKCQENEIELDNYDNSLRCEDDYNLLGMFAHDSDNSCISDLKSKRKVRKKVKMKQEKKGVSRGRRKKGRGLSIKCRDCLENFTSRDDLREHRKNAKHPEAKNHTCSHCDKKFTSSKLRQHMRVHTKEKPFICEVCSQGFSMSGNLKRHMMTHTGERPHVCEVCGKGFIQATTLHIHRRTHVNNGPRKTDENGMPLGPNFICDYCGRGFKRLARCNAHLKKHFADGGVSKKPSPSEEVKEYTCDTCKRAYKTKHLLKAHQLTHGEKSFLCSECGKGFVTKAALISHLKVHTGERPHTCTICKKSFAHVGSFEAHMLIHTGQKPYNCNVCTKAFTQLSHLKYHLRTHSGERPYVCTYCNKTFALKGNLTVHVRIHTGETPYLCPICRKGFYDSSSMKKHQKCHGDVVITVPDADGNPIVHSEFHLK